MKKIYNICLFGTSDITDIAYKSFKLINQNVVAVIGSTYIKAKEFAEKRKIMFYSNNFENIYKKVNIDIAYIGLPNSLHFSYALKMLNKGINVILEKPFCINLLQANKLFEIAQKKSLFLFEAYYTKYLPQFYKLLQIIDKIGNINYINLNATLRSSTLEKDLNLLNNKKFSYELGNSGLLNMGVYGINFLINLLPNKINQWNIFSNFLKTGIDDSGVISAIYENIIISIIYSKRFHQPTSNSIFGEFGYIIFDDIKDIGNIKYKLYNKKRIKKYTYNKDHELHFEFQSFLNIINDKNFLLYNECKNKTIQSMELLDNLREKIKLNFGELERV